MSEHIKRSALCTMTRISWTLWMCCVLACNLQLMHCYGAINWHLMGVQASAHNPTVISKACHNNSKDMKLRTTVLSWEESTSHKLIMHTKEGLILRKSFSFPWWRHQMETFSALLVHCAGNSPVPVNSPNKGQWRGALMFSLIWAWINDWVNNREAGDLIRHPGHYDVNVMHYAIMSSCTYLIVALGEIGEHIETRTKFSV